MIRIIDDRRKLCIFEKERLIPYLVDHFFEKAKIAISEKDRFNVALSGGSTPKALYQALASDPQAKTLDWSKVHVYFGDERAVDFNSKDSNYKMALDAGFSFFQQAHMHPMEAFKQSEDARCDFEKSLPDVLDLIYLGMGDDGHTASLFPNDPMLNEKEKKVAFGFVQSKNAYRMTLTFPYINASKEIIILVQGPSKTEKLVEVLSSNGEKNPIFFIGSQKTPAIYVTDTQTYLI